MSFLRTDQGGTLVRWIVLVSITLFVMLLSLQLSFRMRQEQDQTYLQALVNAEAQQIDLQLESYKAALLTLANSDALVTSFDLSVLSREAQTIGDLFGGWFVLATAGETMEILLNTSGEGPLPAAEPREAYPEVSAAEQVALVTGRPTVSDAFPGRVVKETVVTLAVPVQFDERDGFFLYMSFDTRHLSSLLLNPDLPEGYFLSLADGSRRVIGRSTDIERYELASLPDWFVAATQDRDDGVFTGAAIGDTSDNVRHFALRRLQAAPNWSLVVSAPAHSGFVEGIQITWPVLTALATFFTLLAGTEGQNRYRRLDLARRTAEAEAVEKSALIEALKASEQRRAILLATVGHELRTPLVAQLGMLDLLELAADRHDVNRMIEAARREGHGMLALVDDLLEVARLGSGEARLRESVFHPASLLEDAAALLRPIAARNNNVLTLDVPEAVGPVFGDASAIRRVIINFGTNAAKFTRNGVITLSIASRPLSPDDVELTWSVTDNGIGIAEEDIPNLFKEFGVAKHRQIYTEGTGLGLAICKGLADALGGSVQAKSRLGEGSTFSLRVELRRSEPVRTALLPTLDVDLSGMRILLAEDQELIRMIVSRQLETAGAVVRLAKDGTEAVALAETETFDLILMDLRMPNLDGASAAQHIRNAAGPNASTRIIALTAHQTPETTLLISRGAIDGCLGKPLKLEALAKLVSPGSIGVDLGGPVGEAPEETIDHDVFVGLAGGNRALAIELLRALSRECEDGLSVITEMSRAPDFPAIADEAHRLASLAKANAAIGLVKAFAALEDAARHKDEAGAMEACTKARHLLQGIRDAINARQGETS
jgi:signal transduction histidine kinase/HPt (histidine-containing phosphotransfer) domain-containing protein